MDLQREALMDAAEKALQQAPAGSVVYFKFTCSLCGERCTLADPNCLWEKGECWRCGTETPIHEGGYMLVMAIR